MPARETHEVPRNRRTISLTNRREYGLQKRKSLKIATMNASTLNGKEEEIVERMKSRGLDILGLCETRYRGSGRRILQGNYLLIYSGGEEARHGVALILKENLASRVKLESAVSERLMSVTLQLNEGSLKIIQVYAPQQGRPNAEKEQFYNSLQEEYERSGGEVVLTGDFNGHIGCEREGVEHVIGAFSVGNKNREGERILDFCVLNNLAIMNTFYKHKEEHKWTWYRWSQEGQQYTDKSMIDLIITNNKTLFNDVRAIPSESFDSDHRMVVGKIKITCPTQQKGPTRKRICIENLKEEDRVIRLREKIREHVPTHEPQNVEQEWRRFRDTIVEASEDILETKKVGRPKKKKTAWWTEEVKHAVQLKNRAFRRWMKTRQPEDRIHYVQRRNEAETIKRDAKQESWNKIGEDLARDMQGTRKLIYCMAKNYRKGNKYTAQPCH